MIGKFFTEYFHVPHPGGFSPYRSGESIHLMFSAITAVTAIWICSFFIIPTLLHKAAIALITVFVLWGIGVLLGVESHYSAFITVVILTVFIIIIVKNPIHIIEMGLGTASHLSIRGILTCVQKKIK